MNFWEFITPQLLDFFPPLKNLLKGRPAFPFSILPPTTPILGIQEIHPGCRGEGVEGKEGVEGRLYIGEQHICT
jgi:hypothetical protein